MSGFNVPGDLALSSDGRRLLFSQGADEVGQRCEAALQTFQGLWLYDSAVGIRYLFAILEKPAATGLLQSEIARVLRRVPGIVQVTRVAVEYDRTTRSATAQWNALSDQGPVQGGLTIS